MLNYYYQLSASTIIFVASIFAFILSIFLVENEGGVSTLSLLMLLVFLACSLLRPNFLLTELVTYMGPAIIAGHFFYLMPISHIGLRLDDPNALYDSQKYALSAQMAIQGGDGLGHWMSFGIEQYIIAIYRTFGVEESNVLAANALLLAISLILLFKSVIKSTERNYLTRGILVLCGMPLTLFYAGQGSKEALCIFTTSLFLFSIAPPSTGRRYAILGVLTIVLTLFIRPSLAALYLIFWCGISVRLRRLFSWDLVYALPLAILLVASAIFVSESILGLDLDFWLDYGAVLFDTSSRLATSQAYNANESGLVYQIKSALSPENPILYVLFTPLKMLLVWVSPFPALTNPFAYPVSPVDMSSYVYSLIATTSAVLNVCILPVILYLAVNSKKLSDNERTILYFTIFYVAVIAFSYPTQFTRHRVLIELPMFLIVLRNTGFISSSYSLFLKIAITLAWSALFLMTVIINFWTLQ